MIRRFKDRKTQQFYEGIHVREFQAFSEQGRAAFDDSEQRRDTSGFGEPEKQSIGVVVRESQKPIQHSNQWAMAYLLSMER